MKAFLKKISKMIAKGWDNLKATAAYFDNKGHRIWNGIFGGGGGQYVQGPANDADEIEEPVFDNEAADRALAPGLALTPETAVDPTAPGYTDADAQLVKHASMARIDSLREYRDRMKPELGNWSYNLYKSERDAVAAADVDQIKAHLNGTSLIRGVRPVEQSMKLDQAKSEAIKTIRLDQLAPKAPQVEVATASISQKPEARILMEPLFERQSADVIYPAFGQKAGNDNTADLMRKMKAFDRNKLERANAMTMDGDSDTTFKAKVLPSQPPRNSEHRPTMR